MAAKKAKSSKLKKHRGVTLISPETSQRPRWQARWKDPDTGHLKKENLPTRVTTAEGRADWAAAKLDEIKRRKMALEGGAVRAQGVSVRDAVKLFVEAHASDDPRTIILYRQATDKLVTWCEGPGAVRSCDELTRPRLMAWRTWLQTAPKLVSAKGERPGKLAPGDEPRAASTVNQTLDKVGTVLRYIVDADVCPRLAHDDVRRALEHVREVKEAPRHLSRAECRALLSATLKHDESGKHRDVAGFVLFALLTGMRVDEARKVEWSMVHLDGAGEIRLPARIVKTRKPRDVGLDVSPSVLELLKKRHTEGVTGRVWMLGVGATRYAIERLVAKYGAPDLTWHVLRATCGTYLTCAPSVFGAASVYLSARRLGHSVSVAEQRYLGQARGIPHEAKTLEAAMGIEDLAARIVARAKP